jgi:hypothetical protein
MHFFSFVLRRPPKLAKPEGVDKRSREGSGSAADLKHIPEK